MNEVVDAYVKPTQDSALVTEFMKIFNRSHVDRLAVRGIILPGQLFDLKSQVRILIVIEKLLGLAMNLFQQKHVPLVTRRWSTALPNSNPWG